MLNQSGYSPGGSVSGPPAATSDKDKSEYWTLDQCKQSFIEYTGSKNDEIEEIKDSRRYRHGSQWTSEQISVLNKRKQPIVTYNRIGRKVDGIVGFVERLKQDPKAFPRTPKQDQGADLATAVLRYVCDTQDWKAKTPLAAEAGAVDGIGGCEIEIIEGDKGDKEVGLNLVSDGFFYDPQSVQLDFSDARFMGVSKWLDLEAAKEMFPDKADELTSSNESGTELSTNSDRENRWFSFTGKKKRVRLVDVWYKHEGKWCWSIFTGSTVLMDGESYLFDEKNKTICKYIMFSAAVDHDGDRYGFVRNLKSSQDEINQRRSKGLHILNTRRIIADEGAFDDIEETRREAARPDGVIIRRFGLAAEFDDTAKHLDLQGQIKFLEDAKAEVDNYGPSQVVTGEGVDGQSGRAIALRQQAAVAELGPFVLSYRGWKLRCYRALFCAVQKHWTGERWIRVTDDDNIAQFVQINGMQETPLGPQIVNAIGSLDVDIILDEGPDTINAQQDVFETLKEILPAVAPMLSPGKANAAVDLVISTSGLPGEAKQKFKKVSEEEASKPPQPDPAVAKAQADMQIASQKAQIDAQIKQQAQQTDAQIETVKAQRELEIERVKAQNDIEIAREKAAAEIEIARHKAAMDAQIQETRAHHEANIQGFKAKGEQDRAQMQFKFDSNMKRKEMGETVNDDGDRELESPMAKALTHIAELAAKAHAAASAPRVTTIIRDKSGKPSGARSELENA